MATISEMSQARKGAWIVFIEKHLEIFSASSERTFFEATERSAQAGKFLSLVRKREFLTSREEREVTARTMKVGLLDLELLILPLLERRELVSLQRGRDGELRQISLFPPPNAQGILTEVASIWEDIPPESVERAVLHACEICSLLPHERENLLHYLESLGFRDSESNLALKLISAFRLLKEVTPTGGGKPVYYNEYIFKGNPSGLMEVLQGLSTEQRTNVIALVDRIRRDQGIPVEYLQEFPEEAFEASRRMGLVDCSRIKTRAQVEKEFAFTPHLFILTENPSDLLDLWDEAKLFTSSIVFGNRFAPYSTGRIGDPLILLESLLRYGEVGPATAIGRDYPLLEAHGIIQTRESKIYPGRFHMKLLKRDVVERSFDILKGGNILELDSTWKTRATGLQVPGRFTSPEADRLALGEASEEVAEVMESIVRVWRREKL